MFQRLLRQLKRKSRAPRRRGLDKADQSPTTANKLSELRLSPRLGTSLEDLKLMLGDPDDLIVREFLVANRFPAALVAIDGLVDRAQLNDQVLRPLMTGLLQTNAAKRLTTDYLPDQLQEAILSVAEVRQRAVNLHQAADAVLTGGVALLLDGHEEALLLSLIGWEKRGVEEPSTETVVRGPRQGFNENLRTNTSLVRRYLKSPNLRFEAFTLGRVTQTKVLLAYLKGTANEKIVAEVRHRLSGIDLDGVLESAYIEEMIEDHPFTPFPQLATTERPDVAAAHLLEGRIAIFTEGTPFVLAAPAVFLDFLISPEDYYNKAQIVVLVRGLRFLAAAMTILLPAA